jgi:DMSO reductase family type II enzyme heme b subunit
MPGSAMPPWNHLPDADLKALAAYVRQIHSEAEASRLQEYVADGSFTEEEARETHVARTRPGAALVVPSEPPFDDIRWHRGRTIYLQACASCHGVDGHPVAEAIKVDNEGYPVAPRSFVNGIFKGGSEGHQLWARTVKGMKGTPMPAHEGNYSDDDMWDLIHYVQSLARSGAQERALLRQGTIVAPRISGPLPPGPLDTAWDQARPLYVSLTPLWWTEERIEGLVVQAMHDENELAIRMSWVDPSQDAVAVRHQQFSDAVAIQFSMTSDPPFYMGSASEHGGVSIWYWKADRQQNLAGGHQDVDSVNPGMIVDMYPEQEYQTPADRIGAPWPVGGIQDHRRQFITAWGASNLVANPERKTSVDTLSARGPGTLGGNPMNLQLVEGAAAYERGVWYVQMRRNMKPTTIGDDAMAGNERIFKAGDYLPLSFAIWNGNAGDRDGKKNISIWQRLVIK